MVTRACLADDLFNLARFGLANYTHVFRLLDVWSTVETSHAPWKAVIDNLQRLLETATESNLFRGLQRFVAAKIAISFDRIVTAPPPGKTISQQLKTALTRFACTTMRLTDCVAQTRAAYATIAADLSNLTSPANILPQLDEVYTVLCTALAMPGNGSDWSSWSLVHDAIGRVDDPPLNRMLIGALACGTRPAMMRGFVALLGRDSLRRYRATVFAAAGRNAVLRMFVLEHLLTVEQRRTDDVMVFFRSLASELEFEMVRGLEENVKGRFVLTQLCIQLERIFAKYPNYAKHQSTTWQSIVRDIQSTIAWKQRLHNELQQIAAFE